MKLSLKHIYICSLIGLGASTLASCNDFLDREPITNVTPEAYFTTVDQVGVTTVHLANKPLFVMLNSASSLFTMTRTGAAV